MKREKNNIANIVFCLLALLPILLILISCYSTGSYDISTMEQALSTLTSISFMSDIKHIVLGEVLKWPSNITNVWLNFAIDYFSWLFVLSVIDLCYYAILFFFRIIKDLIDKLGGNI